MPDLSSVPMAWSQRLRSLLANTGPCPARLGAVQSGEHPRSVLTNETTWFYGRSFGWTCRSCDKAISDRGPCNGPADDEHGHARNCTRLAATIADWDAQWEAGQ
jgi:hypothetical protein